MLKIKDSVDLKELEKYGFKCYSEEKQLYDIQLYDDIEYGKEEINIYGKGEICISLDGWETNRLDLIYDLIKADLVEKVSD